MAGVRVHGGIAAERFGEVGPIAETLDSDPQLLPAAEEEDRLFQVAGAEWKRGGTRAGTLAWVATVLARYSTPGTFQRRHLGHDVTRRWEKVQPGQRRH